MGMRLELAVAAALVASALGCASQDAQPAQAPGKTTAKTPSGPVGTLTGTVLLADTNLPARLATVFLLQDSRRFQQAQTAVTDLEGRFYLDPIPAGQYYVVASLPGYLDLVRMFAEIDGEAAGSDARKAFDALAPTVEISSSQPAEVSIRMERASEIDGTVTYDDGSPAVSLEIHARRKSGGQAGDAPADASAQFASFADSMLEGVVTDDRGQFRLPGVAPGEYLVSASVPAFSAQAGGSLDTDHAEVTVFSGGSLRAGAANSVKVGSGDSAVDADITIPLSRLHTIRGQVALKSNSQPAPFARIALLFADTREQARTAYARDGAFELHYVPEDSFILQAMAVPNIPEAPDDSDKPAENPDNTPQAASETFTVSPGANTGSPDSETETPLTITGDVDNITITVPDIAAPASSTQEQTQTAPMVGVGPALAPVP